MRILWILLLLALVMPAAAQNDETTLVVFSRHTFRGLSHPIGPQAVELGQFGLNLSIPMLSWGMEASPHGLELARRFGPLGLNSAASLATMAISKEFVCRWDEVRVDLSCSRTFFTGRCFQEGLQKGQSAPILLTGCPTLEREGNDAVTIGQPIKKCIPAGEIARLLANSPNLERLRHAGESLLSQVGAAAGLAGPFAIDPAKPVTDPVYHQIGLLAGAIEMASDLGPPLQFLLPGASKSEIRKYDPDAVRRASNYLGVRFTAQIPMELACAASVIPIRYINSTPAGHHVIVLSHDDDLSSLCRSLGLIKDDGNVDDLAMYPMESIVFALSPTPVSVARMRIEIAADGSIPGPFQSSLMWQGSRAEWDHKVDKVIQQAQTWPAGAAERAKVQMLTPLKLDVLTEKSN